MNIRQKKVLFLMIWLAILAIHDVSFKVHPLTYLAIGTACVEIGLSPNLVFHLKLNSLINFELKSTGFYRKSACALYKTLLIITLEERHFYSLMLQHGK